MENMPENFKTAIALEINGLLVADNMWKESITRKNLDDCIMWRKAYFKHKQNLRVLGIPMRVDSCEEKMDT
jgi:hypothetical protein